MTQKTALRVSELDQKNPTAFALCPDSEACKALADSLELTGLRKLSFSGDITASGQSDWILRGELGATVTQACVVTLEPVTTRIDIKVSRTFVADLPEPDAPETEMPEDDTVEKLGAFIDPGEIMAEELALALPLYPRKDGVDLEQTAFAEPGIRPLTDEDVKPFAGLSDLRDALKNKK